MISFDCQCGKPFRFSLKFRGRQFRCNTCGRPLVVEESQPSLTADAKQSAFVGPGEVITPVKSVLQLDPPRQQVPVSEPEDEDDGIIISGSLSKAGEEGNVFHIDLDIDELGEEVDSTSTILSKAAISQHLLEEQERTEAEQSASSASEKTKKSGLLSGFFKKKPVVPNVIDITEESADKLIPAPKVSKKVPKALKKQLPAPDSAKPVAEPASGKAKKGGFGFFKKKPATPVAVGIAENDAPKPAPVPKKEKKGGFGFFKKKPTAPVAIDIVESDAPKPAPVPKKEKKGKVMDTASVPSQKNGIITKILVFLGPILIVTLGALWFWERTQANAEREKVVKLERDIQNLRNQVNDLRQNQTPQAMDEPDMFDDEETFVSTAEPASDQDLSQEILELDLE